ncbi:MAG: lipid-A-disaccharide synthase [Bacteroidetes bacterium]|nr:lipid-A-disaccharide synthase [Bacteroidota bacterium]
MKYYLIAGEASGDMHGANLMRELAAKDPSAEFRFWGGDKMAKIAHGVQVEHYKNTAFMGFVEVLKHLPTIFKFIKKCKEDILHYQPDFVIFIDYPGFNLRIAKFAKHAGFKTIYYISPQVWAWKQNRVKKIKAYIDKMLVILPFEQDFYATCSYPVDYVGHPLLDEIQNKNYPLEIDSNKKIIALFPGSRKQEIAAILPKFLEVEAHFPSFQFIVAGLAHIEEEFYRTIFKTAGSQALLVKNKNYALLQASEYALVASGTATLETALFKVPMVVGYKGSFLSYHIGKYLIKVPYIALVNLIMGEKVVQELIQNDLNAANLKKELNLLMEPNVKREMQEKFAELKIKLGNSGASRKAAESILS